jgi:hypothetical protein
MYTQCYCSGNFSVGRIRNDLFGSRSDFLEAYLYTKVVKFVICETRGASLGSLARTLLCTYLFLYSLAFKLGSGINHAGIYDIAYVWSLVRYLTIA